ncbi:MAG: IS3 family transposase [Acidaminococcus sp.]|jgi:transposase InsO family protein|nr:IS3 family transposase [Acidaminococcus sp.]
MGFPSYQYELIEATLQQHKIDMSVSELCRVAGVSRSGYYAWLKAAPVRAERETRDKADFAQIVKAYFQGAHETRRKGVGAKEIHMVMIHWDPPLIMNLKKIHRLMNKFGLRCSIRKANPHRRAMKALKTGNYADNELERRFKEFGPRMVLLTDITYLFYGRYEQNKAYLSTVKDAYTNEILAHSVGRGMEVDTVLEMIDYLIRDYGGTLHKETILHSDQGSQYIAIKYIDLLEDIGLHRSMSRRANCWDNAPQESFFGHMKDEVDLTVCHTFEELKAAIDDYMDYYNNRRYQWNLAKLAPSEYYQFVTTGKYPLAIPNPPAVPKILRSPEELVATKKEKQKTATF